MCILYTVVYVSESLLILTHLQHDYIPKLVVTICGCCEDLL